ncbi:MAG: LytTR family DNA-binding domain-containing protein [Bacteroidota bacterium]
MNILIVEDEIRAAQQVKNMLEHNFSDAHILEIIESVEDGVEWLANNTSPDLILMDIQLADGLSFEIFQKVKVEAPVIFTTAYDQYSIKAFKVNSIDYLLKPIQEDDLKFAIKKYKNLFAQKSSPIVDRLTIEKLINNLTEDKFRQRFVVKEGNSMTFVQVEDIAFFYSEDGISFLMTLHGKRYIVDMTIDAIEKDLSVRDFHRINRGQIVNIKSIEKIHPYFNHRLKLEIRGNKNHEFIVSRNRTSEFKGWVNS